MFLKPGTTDVLRNSTSPQIISVMKKSSAHATSARVFKSFPYHCESASISICHSEAEGRRICFWAIQKQILRCAQDDCARFRAQSLREQGPHLRPVLRAHLDDARPAHF